MLGRGVGGGEGCLMAWGSCPVAPVTRQRCYQAESRNDLSSALPPIKVMLELLVVTTQSADKASTLPGGRRERGFILRIDVLMYTVKLSSH